MKNILQKGIVALALFLTTGFATVQASHLLGGDISYTCVGPNTYLVKYKFFSECSGPSVPTTQVLEIVSPGCNVGRGIVLNRVSGSVIGDPYCTALGNICSGSTRLNYEEVVYAGTLTFSATEAACPNWKLSVSGNARISLANLVNSQGDMYIESYLNLGNGINNNSAVINPNAPAFEHVCVGQETKLSLTAYDPDCDSLSYELVAPMLTSGAYYSYAPVTQPSTGAYFVNPFPQAPYCNTCTPSNPQIGYFPGPPVTIYSPTFPLVSYYANWASGNQVVPAYPSFDLDSVTGQLSFRPAVYVTGSTPAMGQNQYIVVVKVNEWRKVNGVVRNVGYTRRDMVFLVEDCGSNQNPSVTNLVANGQQIQSGDIITVHSGAQLNLQFATSDDPADTLTLDSDVTTQLPSATFTQTSAAKPTGTISWTAPATNGTCGIRYFYIRVRDNACPIRGKKVYVIGVKVTNTGAATGTKEELKTDLNFTAYPNPFSQEVSFKFNSAKAAREIRIYNLLGQEIDVVKVTGNENKIRWEKASRFASGTYVAKLITSDNSVQTLKFSKLQ